MNILSICSGGGGIDEGIKQTGFQTKLAIDRDPKDVKYSKDCKKTFELNHPDTEFIVGDILEHEDSFGRFDVVVGGVPCPDFSSANAKRTFDDTLVKCFWRIVKKTKVKYWMMENVPDVIQVCKNRNYLINCADYGTPQIRKRRLFTNLKKPDFTHAPEAYVDLMGVSVKKWVSVEEALGLKGIMIDKKFGHWKRDKSGSYSTQNPLRTIDTQPQEIFVQDRKTTFGDGWRTRKAINPCFTLLSDSRAWLVSKIGFDGEFVRKLTNDETKIIQGFPKDYRFHGGKTSVKKQIGNAMPPQPIKAFFEQLKN